MRFRACMWVRGNECEKRMRACASKHARASMRARPIAGHGGAQDLVLSAAALPPLVGLSRPVLALAVAPVRGCVLAAACSSGNIQVLRNAEQAAIGRTGAHQDGQEARGGGRGHAAGKRTAETRPLLGGCLGRGSGDEHRGGRPLHIAPVSERRCGPTSAHAPRPRPHATPAPCVRTPPPSMRGKRRAKRTRCVATSSASAASAATAAPSTCPGLCPRQSAVPSMMFC